MSDDLRAQRIEAAAVLVVKAIDQGHPLRIRGAVDALRAALTEPYRVRVPAGRSDRGASR